MLSLRSDTEPLDASDVRSWVYEDVIGQYFQVATVTVLVYDTITTMDKEVKYFWRAPRKAVNIVYFANRYIGILGAVACLLWYMYNGTDSVSCKFSQWVSDIANWTTIISIDYILMIRVLALCAHNEILSVILKILLAMEAAYKMAMFIYLDYSQDILVVTAADNQALSFCDYGSFPSWRWGLVDWIIPMTYGLLLMALALYKAAEYWRTSAGLKGFTLVKVLVRDQFIYFLLVVICCVVNIMNFKLNVNNFVGYVLAAIGNPSFLCVLGSRMSVNLKEAGERGLNEGTSYRLKSVSAMQFV